MDPAAVAAGAGRGERLGDLSGDSRNVAEPVTVVPSVAVTVTAGAADSGAPLAGMASFFQRAACKERVSACFDAHVLASHL